MDRKQIHETIIALQCQTREALRQLAEVEDISASGYVHVSNAQQTLSEHMQLLIQLREEVMYLHSLPSPSTAYLPSTETIGSEKRTRGGQKQFYLLDNAKREEYTLQIHTLFTQHYDTATRTFKLHDGTQVKAPLFLACIYDLGIKNGLAAPGAPVKDFADIVKEAAKDTPNFTTAYNTIQNVIKQWRTFIGNRGYFNRSLHLYSINHDHVVREHKKEYNECMDVMNKIEKLF